VPPQMPPQAPTNELADKNYRVRRLFIKIDLDLYDDDGFLLTRGETEPLVVNEAEIPAGLIDFLKQRTELGKGFIPRPVPNAPGDTPQLRSVPKSTTDAG